jgi:hypothetical protein
MMGLANFPLTSSQDALFISAFLTSDGVANASEGDRAGKIQRAIELFQECVLPC